MKDRVTFATKPVSPRGINFPEVISIIRHKFTGDNRVNQNPQLTVLQVLLLREHNRIATNLAKINPHWSDETIYQEARRIAIAEYQQISYYEWLPPMIGKKI